MKTMEVTFMNLIPWGKPYEIERFREEMDRFFDRSLGNFFAIGMGRHPYVDVYQTDNEVIVKAEIPGVNPEDIEILATEDTLTIKGEIKHQEEIKEHGYIHRERKHGSFYRSIPLPYPVRSEEARASLNNGVLDIRLPKSENHRERAVKIQIEDRNKH
jgi:HSP20 family protein